MMDLKMMDELKEELTKLGIEEKMIDERMLWGSKKLILGIMKINHSLKESGLSDDEARQMIGKMVDKITDKEMMEKIEKMWSEKMKYKEEKM